MIIDAHMHLTGHGWVRGHYMLRHGATGQPTGVWAGWTQTYNRQHGTKLTIAEYAALMRKTAASPDGSYHLKIMDRAGIDHAVIFGVDWSILTGEPRVTQQEQNKAHAAAMKAHPDRFTALGSLDLRRGNLLEMAKECIEDFGLKGFYVMSAAGFRYEDECYFPFYELCAKSKVVCNLHSGSEIHHLDYGDPVSIGTVAAEFRDLTVVLGHGGQHIFRHAATDIASMSNVYLDYGGPDPIGDAVELERWYRTQRWRMDEIGADKLMLGAGISVQETVPMPECIKALKEPQTKIKFTKKELDAFLGKTAQKVYKIKG